MKQKYRFDIKQMTADCEANYARLIRLFPGLLELASTARVAVNDGSGRSQFDPLEREIYIELCTPEPAKLTIQVAEQCKFTTTLLLQFAVQTIDEGINDSANDKPHEKVGEASKSCSTTTMSIRMYHDVHLAEVVAISGKRLALASYEYPNETMFQPDEKAQQNRFLSEVLSLGLNKGFVTEQYQVFETVATVSNFSVR